MSAIATVINKFEKIKFLSWYLRWWGLRTARCFSGEERFPLQVSGSQERACSWIPVSRKSLLTKMIQTCRRTLGCETYVDVGNELNRLTMLAKVLRLDVFQNLHAMATCESCIECIRGKATSAEAVSAILAVLFFVSISSWYRLRIELELLLVPSWK